MSATSRYGEGSSPLERATSSELFDEVGRVSIERDRWHARYLQLAAAASNVVHECRNPDGARGGRWLRLVGQRFVHAEKLADALDDLAAVLDRNTDSRTSPNAQVRGGPLCDESCSFFSSSESGQ